MSNFIVKNWFANRAIIGSIQTFVVEGIEFDIMALTESLKDDIKLCDTYEEMLSLAANSGLSYNGLRVADDVELSKDIDMLWGLDTMDVDSDPCIQYRVGEKVCEISGLESTLVEQLEAERTAELEALKEQGHVDGDRPTPSVDIDSLNDDAAVAAAVA